jgi:hypothetical protein
MHVELLVVPDCPHQAGAASLLRTTLDELGFEDAAIDTTVIDTVEAAQQRGFMGADVPRQRHRCVSGSRAPAGPCVSPLPKP